MVQIDIDIPENCVECPIHNGEYGWCNANKNISVNFEERPRRCPLIEPEQRFKAKLLTEEYRLIFDHVIHTLDGKTIQIGLPLQCEICVSTDSDKRLVAMEIEKLFEKMHEAVMREKQHG